MLLAELLMELLTALDPTECQSCQLFDSKPGAARAGIEQLHQEKLIDPNSTAYFCLFEIWNEIVPFGKPSGNLPGPTKKQLPVSFRHLLETFRDLLELDDM